MTPSAHIRTICAVAALALPAAGCGDKDVGDPIPGGKAAELEGQLDRARANFEQDRCDDATTAVNRARTVADTLDEDGVGSDVQDAVADGIDNLGTLLARRCEEEEPVETAPETTPTVPTTPDTETDTTETTEPTTPAPEPEPPTPAPEPEPEPDEEGGGRQFDPNADIPPGQRFQEDDD